MRTRSGPNETGFGGLANRAAARRIAVAAGVGVLLLGIFVIRDVVRNDDLRLAPMLARFAMLGLVVLGVVAGLIGFGGTTAKLMVSGPRQFDPEQFVAHANEAAFVVGLSGEIVVSNAHLAALLGVDPHDVPGADLTEILPGSIIEAITVAFELGLDSSGAIECENNVGEWLTVEVRCDRVRIRSEQAFAFTIRDLTEARRREIELASLAFQDSLTRLANRAALQRRMARLKDDLDEGPEASFGVLVLDLDRFKQVNDHFGHAGGDELLREVARRIVETAPRNAFVARNGGDEFVIVAGPRANYASMRQLAQHIIEAVARPAALHAGVAEVGVSIGIALAPADGEDSQALIHAADNAMYRAKRSGSGFVFVNDPAEAPSLKSVA